MPPPRHVAPLDAPDARVTTVRRRLARRLGWAAVPMLPGGVALGVLLAKLLERLANGGGEDAGALAGFGLPVMLVIAALVLRSARLPLATGARVEGGALLLGNGADARRVERSELRSGIALRDENAVLLERANGDHVVVPVPRGQTTQQWLDALALGAQQQRVAVHFRRWFTTLLYGLVVAPSAVMGAGALLAAAGTAARIPGGGVVGAFVGGLVVGPALAYLLWRGGLGTRVVIGADGVLVQRHFRSTFLPYAQLSSVTLERTGMAACNLRFERTDATVFSVWADGDMGLSPQTALQRIHDALRAFRDEPRRALPADALARHGRSVSDWRAALGTLMQGPRDYRAVSIDRGALLAVLDDVRAPVEQRIAAALAASTSGDPELVARVRVAAEASASEPVRVALAHAGDGTLDDEAYERAVAHEQRVRVAAG